MTTNDDDDDDDDNHEWMIMNVTEWIVAPIASWNVFYRVMHFQWIKNAKY